MQKQPSSLLASVEKKSKFFFSKRKIMEKYVPEITLHFLERLREIFSITIKDKIPIYAKRKNIFTNHY